MDDFAKIAYDAWRADGGLATILSPAFEDLGPKERYRWSAVAQAILDRVAENERAAEPQQLGKQHAEAIEWAEETPR